MSRNIVAFTILCSILTAALFIGIPRTRHRVLQDADQTIPSVPFIGSIQVLNGCGTPGAADKAADFLRTHNFDVKYIGNAETWNYPFTMVISRTKDMTIARMVAASLKTDRCVLLRTDDSACNVTVIIGPDYGETIP